jgi:hypothetical protein
LARNSADTNSAAARAAWYWHKSAAEDTLYNEGLNWSEGFETVSLARCRGQGAWIWSDGRPRAKLFRKFGCYIETDAVAGEDRYYVRLMVRGKFRWDFAFLNYADGGSVSPPSSFTPPPSTTVPPSTLPVTTPSSPTTQPTSQCHPSYAGACLDPSVSDYDCLGGSGNGPGYTGLVSVIGPDQYGLDADNDGIGCE